MNKFFKNLDILIKPNIGSSSSFDETVKSLLIKIDKDKPSLQKLNDCLQRLPDTSYLEKFSWWHFIQIVSCTLIDIKSCLQNTPDDEKMLSISQTKTVKGAIEILISIGILPNLSQGVGVSIKQRSNNHKIIDFNLSILQKNTSLAFTVEVLLNLLEEEIFEEIIINNYLGDLLSSLFHILLIDVKEDKTFSKTKSFYKTMLEKYLDINQQPLVTRELLILNGNKNCPPRLQRLLRSILTEKLVLQNGVLSTLKAILDIAGDSQSPRYWHIVNVLAKLIITPHKKDVNNYYAAISPQVLSLLSSTEKSYVQISVVCIKNLYEKDPFQTEQYFLKYLIKALKEPSVEEDITLCIDRLHNCFAIPSSDLRCLPPQILMPYAKVLFNLHCKVCSSVSHLKSKVEDILWYLISTELEKNSSKLISSMIFDQNNEIVLSFQHGESGGVVSNLKNEPLPIEEVSDCFLSLIVKRDIEGKVKVIVFKFLLELITIEVEELEKRAVAAKLLSVISSDAFVLNYINQDATCIIQFLKILLERKLRPCSFDIEIMCLGLMVLSVILSNRDLCKSKDWKIFECLIQPLSELKKDASNEDLKILADEIHCLILSHGIVNHSINTQNPANDKNSNKIRVSGTPSNFDEALQEACDSLLPVRGHGLRELARLLKAGDKQAKAKKEQIFCIFKENLKDSDSYIYLSAIEGLASMASVFPDDVLVALAEQYSICKEADLRLKIGEILIRVSRLLGDMIYVYKGELINAFLHGCKDQDLLVRASSLSNLGEMCKMLTFHIGVYAVEIFECVRSIFETDSDPEPRRAAVMVFTLIIKGLGRDVFSVLDSVLLQIYRRLKFLSQIEKDDITKLHIQIALEELNHITKDYICPKPTFSKKIFVLDPPP